MSDKAVSFFKAIFVRDPDMRLGSGNNGADNIKNHPFFDTVDWSLIDNKLIKSPFKPKLKSEEEPVYIDDEFKNMSPNDSNGGDSVGEENQLFSKFSFNNEFCLDNHLVNLSGK